MSRHRAPASSARLSRAFTGAMVAATSLLVAGVATASPAVTATPVHMTPLPAPSFALPPLSVASAAWYLMPLPPAPAAPAPVAPAMVEQAAVEKPVSVKVAGAGGLAARAVSAALGQRGVAYVYGGNTPGKALDCSSLVQYAFRTAGVTLPRTAAAQASMGRTVPLSQVQAGDLLFFYAPITHVAMALGDGRVVEASQPGHPVAVRSLYTNGLTTIKRITG